MSIPIHCKYDGLVDPTTLSMDPENPNEHSLDQLEAMAEVILANGWREAIRVSNLTGTITSGNGRCAMAILKGWETVPVVYQDYENETQQYQDLVAANALGKRSKLNLSMINLKIQDLGPDLRITNLGIKDFKIEPLERFPAGTQICITCGKPR